MGIILPFKYSGSDVLLRQATPASILSIYHRPSFVAWINRRIYLYTQIALVVLS